MTFAIWGFFASYLAFRMFFTPAFQDVDNSGRLLRKAESLERSDNNAQAAGVFQDALAQLPADASPTKRRLAAEGVVMNALYRNPPDGFRLAIAAGTDYLRQSGNPPSAMIHVYLASAYGQQYTYEQARGGEPRRLTDIERHAFDEASEAIALDPSAKSTLRSLWDSNEQVAVDDDLQVFHPSVGRASQDWARLLA